MLITIDLKKVINILPLFHDEIQIYLHPVCGLRQLSEDDITDLMELKENSKTALFLSQDKYSTGYREQIKVCIPSVEKSSAKDPINTQLKALALFQVIAGKNPVTDVPLPLHLSYLKSFYDPLSDSDNVIHPDFCCAQRTVTRIPMIERFDGASNKLFLVNCLQLIRKLKISIKWSLWLQEGVTEYEAQLTPRRDLKNQRRTGMMTAEEFRNSIREQIASPANPLMKMLIWNCKGAANGTFRRNFYFLVESHSPKVIILTETRLKGIDATQIMESLDFDSHAKVDSIGLTGGICILWNSIDISVQIVEQHDQKIEVMIKMSNQSTGSDQDSSQTP